MQPHDPPNSPASPTTANPTVTESPRAQPSTASGGPGPHLPPAATPASPCDTLSEPHSVPQPDTSESLRPHIDLAPRTAQPAAPPAPAPPAPAPPAPAAAPPATPANASPDNTLPVSSLAATSAPAPSSPPPSATRGWRQWVGRLTVRQSLESWTGSFLLHLVVLVLLATITLSIPVASSPQRIIEVLERPQDLLNERLDADFTPASVVSLAAPSGAIGAATHGQPLTQPTEATLDERTAESLDGPSVRLADVTLQGLESQKLVDDLGMASPGDPSAVVSGYKPAMDRITQELLVMLAKGPVLVTWLFDQSESMKNDQQEIRDNVEEIYQELKLTSADDGDQLLTSIASFGREPALHTRRPTNDLDTIRAAIDEVPVDESGVEAMCASLIEVIRQHRKFATQGRRQLALILVTDESGDDPDGIEAAIDAARDANCRVYILGREAVFGYPFIHIIWQDPATGYDYWIPIRRGPETPFPELLQTDGLWKRRDAFPSGFGPYEQVRLARRTGGVFYLLPSLESNVLNGEQRLYAAEAMRPYLPDLDSRDEYDAQLRASPLRLALREVIEMLNPWSHPEVDLAEYYPLEGPPFLQLALKQQEKCQAYVRFLQQAEKRLDELRPRRNEEPLPRWQANYDLMLAQVVGYQVRAYEYAAVVEAFLKNPQRPKDPRTNHWRINPIPQGITGAETQSTVDRARRLLENVGEFHPGTPYAARAAWELQRGFGCQFVEHFHPPDYDQAKRPNF